MIAFSDNGVGNLVFTKTTTTPTCSLKKANAAIQVVALKSAVCETCSGAAQVKHVVVAVRRIQLRPAMPSGGSSSEWVEVAPELASETREIDLMAGSPEILVENAIVPAGSYSEIRLEFSAELGNVERLASANACGAMRSNYVVMGDGHIEPLLFSGDAPVVNLHAQAEGDSFVLLPDTRAELRLSLAPSQVFNSSNSEPWTPRHQLHGTITVVRQ